MNERKSIEKQTLWLPLHYQLNLNTPDYNDKASTWSLMEGLQGRIWVGSNIVGYIFTTEMHTKAR
ncbi:MAG: hypothetical protein COA42_13370 [Alteromonadaceae bacterium]|nr:MAG: hypothetical protein COA42_13370 [Alteromonadaceae bacterium]